mmetsp:Transcript_14600/g.21038  ORF Transcript_14600/g.21038 Transcript_14600/m.21038 type:complete len:81 (+) Transcript_14600:89-331(+)
MSGSWWCHCKASPFLAHQFLRPKMETRFARGFEKSTSMFARDSIAVFERHSLRQFRQPMSMAKRVDILNRQRRSRIISLE